MHFRSGSVVGLMFAAALSLPAQTASNPIHLTVDLTEAPRKILHAHMTIPVSPGPLTLLYPKWIPGEHMADGPIDNLAGLFIRTLNGQQLSWVRDDVNMYAIHLTVPEGVSELDVKDDFLATAGATGFSAGASTSANLAMLSWNELVLYPEGHKDDADIYVEPAVVLPQGWQYGTALQPDVYKRQLLGSDGLQLDLLGLLRDGGGGSGSRVGRRGSRRGGLLRLRGLRLREAGSDEQHD